MEATERQKAWIRDLIRKGLTDDVDVNQLSAEQASEIITESTGAKRPQRELKREFVNGKEKAELNRERFGMCCKLVFNAGSINVFSAKGEKEYKEAVKVLYDIVGDIEKEMQA